MAKTTPLALLLAVVASCSHSPESSSVITPPDSATSADHSLHYQGKLTGTWYRNSIGNRATLLFEPISPERVRFSITALAGAHSGDVQGFLSIDGHRATFRSESEEYGDCLLLFDGAMDRSIRVEQEGCTGYGGLGVAFLGVYERGWTPDVTLALAALEERYGNDVTREIVFKTGLDFEVFASSMHQEFSIETNDKFLEATEYSVRGLHGSMTSCIAVNSQTGEVWVAYVRDRELLHTGPLEQVPDALRLWMDDLSARHELTLVQKPDPI